jgi:endonuclease/exonuclease/phosphatase (EEP) superfamily protein YafD
MLHARDAQLLGLQARLDGLSQTAILIGDLNATPWTHSLSQLKESTGLSTSRAGSGLLNSPEGTWPSRFPWFLRIPIDHCLIRGNLQVVSDRLIPIPDSDHLGLVVSVRVGG